MGASSATPFPATNLPFLLAVATGSMPGRTQFRLSGYNPDVDNTTETLWPVGGAYTFPAAAQQMEVVSSSAADAAAGTGVRTVELHYLDANYAEQRETIALNGVTPVATVAVNILRVLAFHTLTAGSVGQAAGDIDLRHISDTPIYARILTGGNTSQMAVYTIPAGKTGYIVGWYASASAVAIGHYMECRLRATCQDEQAGVTYVNGIFFTKASIGVQDGVIYLPVQAPIVLPAKTDVKIDVVSDAGASNVIAFGGFEGWFE